MSGAGVATSVVNAGAGTVPDPRRPLLICDCDEVLLHFIGPFADYLSDEHDMEIGFESFALAGNIRRRACGTAIAWEEVAPLLDGFFDTRQATQTPAPGVVEALGALAERADIVILTNVAERHRAEREAELMRHGMPYPVRANQGPKGRPVAALAEGRTGPVVFVDDLPPHHESVAKHAPQVGRLHMIADRRLRGLIPAAAHAHARIDDWPQAAAWIAERLGIGATA